MRAGSVGPAARGSRIALMVRPPAPGIVRAADGTLCRVAPDIHGGAGSPSCLGTGRVEAATGMATGKWTAMRARLGTRSVALPLAAGLFLLAGAAAWAWTRLGHPSSGMSASHRIWYVGLLLTGIPLVWRTLREMLEAIANDEARLGLAGKRLQPWRLAADEFAANRFNGQGDEIFRPHDIDDDRRPRIFLGLGLFFGQELQQT